MELLIELPPALAEELMVGAGQRGVSPSKQATFLLQLVSAVTREGRKSPLRGAVEAYLREKSLDADRLADVFEGLMTLCIQNEDPASIPPDSATSSSLDALDRDRIFSLLRGGESSEADSSVDHDVATSSREHPPLDQMVQTIGRKNRVSALGSFAHLNLSTDAFIAEKRLETAREDRPR